MREDIGGREDNDERRESERRRRIARGSIRRRKGPRFGERPVEEEGRDVYPLL